MLLFFFTLYVFMYTIFMDIYDFNVGNKYCLMNFNQVNYYIFTSISK